MASEPASSGSGWDSIVVRQRRNLMALLLAWLALFSTGCQTLQPFADRTRAKIVSAREWANGGLEAFQCGRLQQAKGYFSRATAQRPDDFRTRANLARTLHQAGETAEAIAHMQQAVEQSGNDPVMLVELGEMYLSAGQLSPANRQAQAAINVDHKLARAWKLKGHVSRAKAELDQALAEFQKAAGYAPQDLTIQMDIAQTYRMQDQPLKALAAIEHLLAKHPVDRQPEAAVITKADVLLSLNQYPSAIAMLQQAGRDQRPSRAVLMKLAQAQVLAGQNLQAKSTLAQATAAFGSDGETRRLAEAIRQLDSQSGRLVIR